MYNKLVFCCISKTFWNICFRIILYNCIILYTVIYVNDILAYVSHKVVIDKKKQNKT